MIPENQSIALAPILTSGACGGQVMTKVPAEVCFTVRPLGLQIYPKVISLQTLKV